ncbi:Uncharacterized protein dnl_32990 [Desulfonema limicola]|uniref:Lipoprotein n=1 Tax=Desulfonema limicola TaxID=45656 RepID=A0A975GH26_9BACT|nr:hypothetical protein [Desulfonema limicola]QTA80981.1 Uncharacterized protein dnl_32990 [Desulfonema limicola]
MNSKFLKILFISFMTAALISCSVGGKEDTETDDGTYYYEPEDVCQGPPLFSYTIRPDNADQPFSAHGRTQFRIIHTGNCIYNLELIISSSREIYQTLAEGYGDINLLRVYDLPENDYIIEGKTEAGCTWDIEIESLEIEGCGDADET